MIFCLAATSADTAELADESAAPGLAFAGLAFGELGCWADAHVAARQRATIRIAMFTRRSRRAVNINTFLQLHGSAFVQTNSGFTLLPLASRRLQNRRLVRRRSNR